MWQLSEHRSSDCLIIVNYWMMIHLLPSLPHYVVSALRLVEYHLVQMNLSFLTSHQEQ